MDPEPLKLPTHCSGCGEPLRAHPQYMDPTQPGGDYLGLCSTAHTWRGSRPPERTCWGRLYRWMERAHSDDIYKMMVSLPENDARLLVIIDEWLQLGQP